MDDKTKPVKSINVEETALTTTAIATVSLCLNQMFGNNNLLEALALAIYERERCERLIEGMLMDNPKLKEIYPQLLEQTRAKLENLEQLVRQAQAEKKERDGAMPKAKAIILKPKKLPKNMPEQ